MNSNTETVPAWIMLSKKSFCTFLTYIPPPHFTFIFYWWFFLYNQIILLSSRKVHVKLKWKPLKAAVFLLHLEISLIVSEAEKTCCTSGHALVCDITPGLFHIYHRVYLFWHLFMCESGVRELHWTKSATLQCACAKLEIWHTMTAMLR